MPRPDPVLPAKPLDGSMPRTRAVRRRRSRAEVARRLPRRTLRVSAVLAYTEPPIWRQLELASDLRLAELHRVLQAAFGWGGGHLHRFSQGSRTWDEGGAAAVGPRLFGASPAPERADRTLISEVLTTQGDRLDYLYDFGDSWEHVLVLEDVVEPAPDAPRARVVDGERAAPPEDCGGVPGYGELVTALADPDQPDHAHLVEWYAEMYGASPADFDPARVDIDTLDRAVRAVVG